MAWQTATSYEKNRTLVQNAWASLDRVLSPALTEWVNIHSIMALLSAAVDQMSSRQSAKDIMAEGPIAKTPFLQRLLYTDA